MPAIYNGYPFVDWDTGTYISSGMMPFVPSDRPAIYGWLIIKTSARFDTLWLVIVFQNILLAYLLWKIYQLIFESDKSYFLLFIAFITAFTSIAWYSNQIIPDIFTPIMVLSFILLHKSKIISLLEKIILILIIALCTTVHSSNLWILLSLIMGILCVDNLIFKLKFNYHSILIGIFSALLGIFITLGINYKIENKWVYNKGAHVFLMGKMLDMGILETFINEYPQAKKYSLYTYKDTLASFTHRNFFFDFQSPLYKQGGWEVVKDEYQAILLDIVTEPKILLSILKQTVICVASQLLQNEYRIHEGLIYKENTCPPTDAINRYFVHESKVYKYSRQAHNLWGQTLDFSILKITNQIIFIFSGVFLLAYFSFEKIREKFTKTEQVLLIYCLVAIISNAIITGGLASVCNRFQARISWLLPAIILLITLNKFKTSFKYLVKKFNQ